MPLALPPKSEDPSNYVSGLLHVTPIYMNFESLWQNILASPLPLDNNIVEDDHSCEVCKPSDGVYQTHDTLDDLHQPAVCSRIHSLLEHLHTPQLVRTRALKEDIRLLTGWSLPLIDDQLASASESPILSFFLAQTRKAVHGRPHVLLAYAWILYMALFSGGRFIRASLANVDPSFWALNNPITPPPDSDAEPDMPLHFFTFGSAPEGDELKKLFKGRFAETETLLTEQEKGEIVEEAKRIFDFMVEIVGELDMVCGTAADERHIPREAGDSVSIQSIVGRLLGLRTRDSVVVTKERRAWANLLKVGSIGHGHPRDGTSLNVDVSEQPSSNTDSSDSDAVETVSARVANPPKSSVTVLQRAVPRSTTP
jgi:heme oxygenase